MYRFTLLFLLAPIAYGKPASLDQMIGQMLITGFRGMTVQDAREAVRDIRYYGVGGLILFDRDVELKTSRNISDARQLSALTRGLQGHSRIPLFIAADQEGGQVANLKPAKGFYRSESPQDLGTRDDLAFTARATKRLVSDLKGVGVNLNLAPVLDLNTNPDNPIIGKLRRSFSDDPAIVSRHATAFVAEHRKEGVLTATKHFPGHGSSDQDSHQDLPDITQSWSPDELIPFKTLVDSGYADIIMSAHLMHRGLDSSYPASLSQRTLTGLLRGRLGFKGVIVSDDIGMKAITKHYGEATAIALAINAGTDMLIVGNNTGKYDRNLTPRVFATIQHLVRRGIIPRSRIESAYRRIMELKRRWLKRN